MANSKTISAGAFTMIASLENGTGGLAAKVAGAHHQTYYCIEVSSLYFQTCTVDLISANGMNGNRLELAEATTPGAAWSRSPLSTLPPATPGGLHPENSANLR